MMAWGREICHLRQDIAGGRGGRERARERAYYLILKTPAEEVSFGDRILSGGGKGGEEAH